MTVLTRAVHYFLFFTQEEKLLSYSHQMKEITKSVFEIDQTTQLNAESAQRTTEAVRDLAQLISQLEVGGRDLVEVLGGQLDQNRNPVRNSKSA